MPAVRIKRGTASQIAAAASANQLAEGELYLVTDSKRLAVGTSVSQFVELPRITVGTSPHASPVVGDLWVDTN